MSPWATSRRGAQGTCFLFATLSSWFRDRYGSIAKKKLRISNHQARTSETSTHQKLEVGNWCGPGRVEWGHANVHGLMHSEHKSSRARQSIRGPTATPWSRAPRLHGGGGWGWNDNVHGRMHSEQAQQSIHGNRDAMV